MNPPYEPPASRPPSSSGGSQRPRASVHQARSPSEQDGLPPESRGDSYIQPRPRRSSSSYSHGGRLVRPPDFLYGDSRDYPPFDRTPSNLSVLQVPPSQFRIPSVSVRTTHSDQGDPRHPTRQPSQRSTLSYDDEFGFLRADAPPLPSPRSTKSRSDYKESHHGSIASHSSRREPSRHSWSVKSDTPRCTPTGTPPPGPPAPSEPRPPRSGPNIPACFTSTHGTRLEAWLLRDRGGTQVILEHFKADFTWQQALMKSEMGFADEDKTVSPAGGGSFPLINYRCLTVACFTGDKRDHSRCIDTIREDEVTSDAVPDPEGKYLIRKVPDSEYDTLREKVLSKIQDARNRHKATGYQIRARTAEHLVQPYRDKDRKTTQGYFDAYLSKPKRFVTAYDEATDAFSRSVRQTTEEVDVVERQLQGMRTSITELREQSARLEASGTYVAELDSLVRSLDSKVSAMEESIRAIEEAQDSTRGHIAAIRATTTALCSEALRNSRRARFSDPVPESETRRRG